MLAPEKYVLAKSDNYVSFQNFIRWLETTKRIHKVVEPEIINIKGKNKVIHSVYVMYSDSESLKTLKNNANNKNNFFCCSKVKLECKFIVAFADAAPEPNTMIRLNISDEDTVGLFETLEEAERVYEQLCSQHQGTRLIVLVQLTGDTTKGEDEDSLVMVEEKTLKIHVSDEVKNSY